MKVSELKDKLANIKDDVDVEVVSYFENQDRILFSENISSVEMYGRDLSMKKLRITCKISF